MSKELSRAERADVVATILAGAAWSLSSCALFGAADAGVVFRLGAPLVGTLATIPSLIHIFLEGERKASMDRMLLSGGAVLLACLGISYLGAAEPWRLAFGYLFPAALMAAAVVALSSVRWSWRIVVSRREARMALPESQS